MWNVFHIFDSAGVFFCTLHIKSLFPEMVEHRGFLKEDWCVCVCLSVWIHPPPHSLQIGILDDSGPHSRPLDYRRWGILVPKGRSWWWNCHCVLFATLPSTKFKLCKTKSMTGKPVQPLSYPLLMCFFWRKLLNKIGLTRVLLFLLPLPVCLTKCFRIYIFLK